MPTRYMLIENTGIEKSEIASKIDFYYQKYFHSGSLEMQEVKVKFQYQNELSKKVFIAWNCFAVFTAVIRFMISQTRRNTQKRNF